MSKNFLHLSESRIVLYYILFGCLWIIGSDMLVEYLANEDTRTMLMHSIKGLNFIFTTGFLLYLTLHKAFSRWRESEKLRITDLESSNQMLRKLSARIENLREEERCRIAREIHDELGQQLTSIKLKLGLAEKIIERTPDRSLNRLLDITIESMSLVDEAIDSVRRVASGLRPLALDHLGLAVAMEEEAREVTKHTGISCELHIEPITSPLPAEIETAAFRIYQEALTNVMRHAKANTVRAECVIRDECLHLTVTDDGIGINPDTASRALSLGMMGMRERAAAHGGELQFSSPTGGGTQVSLCLPLNPPRPNTIV